MEESLQKEIQCYQALLFSAQELALKTLVPALSKEVLEYGRSLGDQRELLDLSHWDPVNFRRGTTAEFQVYSKYVNRMSVGAQCQIVKINNANYPFPEIISMMLEQCDYWEEDTTVIIAWALTYLNDEMKPSDGRYDRQSWY